MEKARGVLFVGLDRLSRLSKLVGVVLVSFLISSSFISAYIDPGTGIAIAGSAWGAIYGLIIVVGAFLARVFIHPIKRFFKRIFGKKDKDKTLAVDSKPVDNKSK